MKTTKDQFEGEIWKAIDKEHRIDRMIKRISRVTWGLTFLLLGVYLVYTLQNVQLMMQRYKAGVASYEMVTDSVTPFFITFGTIVLVVAILSTVGVFLRLRTASLLEIQQRLSHLENMFMAEKD